jgi:hypothetical protein
VNKITVPLIQTIITGIIGFVSVRIALYFIKPTRTDKMAMSLLYSGLTVPFLLDYLVFINWDVWNIDLNYILWIFLGNLWIFIAFGGYIAIIGMLRIVKKQTEKHKGIKSELASQKSSTNIDEIEKSINLGIEVGTQKIINTINKLEKEEKEET